MRKLLFMLLIFGTASVTKAQDLVIEEYNYSTITDNYGSSSTEADFEIMFSFGSKTVTVFKDEEVLYFLEIIDEVKDIEVDGENFKVFNVNDIYENSTFKIRVKQSYWTDMEHSSGDYHIMYYNSDK